MRECPPGRPARTRQRPQNRNIWFGGQSVLYCSRFGYVSKLPVCSNFHQYRKGIMMSENQPETPSKKPPKTEWEKVGKVLAAIAVVLAVAVAKFGGDVARFKPEKLAEPRQLPSPDSPGFELPKPDWLSPRPSPKIPQIPGKPDGSFPNIIDVCSAGGAVGAICRRLLEACGCHGRCIEACRREWKSCEEKCESEGDDRVACLDQCVDQYEETKKKLHQPLFRPESLPEADESFRRSLLQPSHPTSSIKIRAEDNLEAFLGENFREATVRLEYSEVDLNTLISIRAEDNPKVFLGDYFHKATVSLEYSEADLKVFLGDYFRKATVRPESSEADDLDNLDALDSELGE